MEGIGDLLHGQGSEKNRQKTMVKILRTLFTTYTFFEMRSFDVFRGVLKRTKAEFPIKDIKFNVRMWDDKLYMEPVYRAVHQQQSLPEGINYASEMNIEVKGTWIGEAVDEQEVVLLYLHGKPSYNADL
jgi:hypothetical protein